MRGFGGMGRVQSRYWMSAERNERSGQERVVELSGVAVKLVVSWGEAREALGR